MSTHKIEHVDLKSVAELHREHKDEREIMTDRHELEMARAVRAEFPVGTEVLYAHGPNKITAIVVEHGQYSWNADKVIVRNKKSGNKKDIEAWRLEHAVKETP